MDKNCKNCGLSFHVKPSHFSKTTYCSKQCMAVDYRARMMGHDNPNYSGASMKICAACGGAYHHYNTKRMYCSSYCYTHDPERSEERRLHAKYRSSLRKPRRGPRPHLWRGRCAACSTAIRAKRKYCQPCLLIKRATPKALCVICGAALRKIKRTCSARCYKIHLSLRQSGPKSHFWMGGKTTAAMKVRNSLEYAEWRSAVFTRDAFTCLCCKDVGGRLTAHHIKPFSTHPDFRLEVTNGITLCWRCHRGIRGKELEYEPIFQAVIGVA